MLAMYQALVAALAADAGVKAAFGKTPAVFYGNAGISAFRPVVVLTSPPAPPAEFTLTGNVVEPVRVYAACIADSGEQSMAIGDAVFQAALKKITPVSGGIVCVEPRRGKTGEDKNRGSLGDGSGKKVYSTVVELLVTTQNITQ